MLKKLLIAFLLLGAGMALLLATSSDSNFTRQRSQLLAQPVEKVWPLLIDVDGWQHWWPGVEQVKLLGPLQVGTRIELHLKGVLEGNSVELTVLQSPRLLTWQRQGMFGSSAETTVQLAVKPDGTEVSIINSIVGPQARLARLSTAESFEQYQQLFLKSLELKLEEKLQ